MKKIFRYDEAILEGFKYLLSNYSDLFIIGQGLWSPWYVGNSMKDLDKLYGKERIIDTPVSEASCTGLAVGAGLVGMKSIIVHPRMDFMLYAVDPIVNQASKWSHMFGGENSSNVTIRAIINRGGEQGAQHSQSLHSWFAHIPGLRVVMPSTVCDARDLLIASALSEDPVLYIDDRWLYSQEDYLPEVKNIELVNQKPKIIENGSDLTIVASSYSTLLAKNAIYFLKKEGINCELIDLRVINPLDLDLVINSVNKTKSLLVIDGGWSSCGLSAEIIANVVENIDVTVLRHPPSRITLPFAPAPTSCFLEKEYYPNLKDIIDRVKCMHVK